MTRRLINVAACVLLLSSLTACVTTPVSAPDNTSSSGLVRSPRQAQPVNSDAIGQTGPDGGPLQADRGIGGTGAPSKPSDTVRASDRGIGGTGIIGVITGFGSVFVNGIEASYDTTAPVDIDGTTSSTSALRAGQLVAIQADGPETAYRAAKISVRSAVVGRIEASGPGTLTVAGQAVSVLPETWGAGRFGPGNWVRVSGLRRPDGTIIASRFDAAPEGVFLTRGRVVRDGKAIRVGTLVLTEAAAGLRDGQSVIVSGNYTGGSPNVTGVTPEPELPDYGDARLIVETFVQADKGAVSIIGAKVATGPAVSEELRHDGIAVISLERGLDGSYTAVRLRYTDYRGRAEWPNSGAEGPRMLPGNGIASASRDDGGAVARTLAGASAHPDTEPPRSSPENSVAALPEATTAPTVPSPPDLAPAQDNPPARMTPKADPSGQLLEPAERPAPPSANAAPEDTPANSTGGHEAGPPPPPVAAGTGTPLPRRLPAATARRLSTSPGHPTGRGMNPPSGVVTGAVSTTAGDPPAPATTAPALAPAPPPPSSH